MSTKFYTLLTDIGAAKLASAAALGVPLKITHMAVGDGGGVLPTPDAKQTALVNEKRRAALNMLYIDPQNSSQIIAEQVIPENEGGWWIREVGLFDESGALIAVGNCPESYKPQLAEGSGRTQTVRMVLITSSTDNITLKIDPAVVLATRKYVDDKALELKVYADDQMAKHLAAPDPHSQYAPKASPTFTGTPTAPTAAQSVNNTQIATTAFVKSAIAGMVGSAPAALDTLNELAAALGNDPNFATTMLNALAGKQPLDNTLTNLSGKDVAGLLTYLGLNQLATLSGIKNSFPFFDDRNTARLSSITTVGRTVIASDTTAGVLNYLGVTEELALKAPIASPALTGTPTAPTAAQTVNNTQIATTAFVKAAIAALVNSSPAALDTLKELADALGNDANFAATMTNALAGKQPIDPTLTTLAALVGSANTFPYFTGGDTAALATITSFARTLLSRSNADGVLADIGLGRVATSADIQAGTVKKIVDAAGLKAFLPKRSFAANDFIRIPDVPGGLIIQWGTVAKSTPEGVQNVIFPTPFPNFSLMAMATPSNLSGNNGIDVFSQVGAISNSDVNFYFSWVSTDTPADGFRWFALGF